MLAETLLTDNELEYRKKLIADNGPTCPMTKELLSIRNGEVIYSNGKDYFISQNGVSILVRIFGEKFVNERIVTWD